MFKNHLIVAFRVLLKNKFFTLINMLGLAVGMAATLLILHYVYFEYSYDRFHEEGERIYRLRYERTSAEGTSVKFASCCPPAAPLIRNRYPEVEKIARIFRYNAVMAFQDVKFAEERIYFAEPDFLEILKFKFIAGDPLTGIREPNSAFISQSTAVKYFGSQNPVGRTITMDNKEDYQITGIFADIPENSHLKFDILLSFENVIRLYGAEVMEAWGHTGFFTYLRLKEDADADRFTAKLPDLVESEFGDVLKEYQLELELKLQPLHDIHLNSHFMQEYEANGDQDSVKFLLVIALFTMVMAWVNYVNLSTARALNRGKEVGLRKVIGATRLQLSGQFFFEVILIYFFALILALVMVKLILPIFSTLSHVPASFAIWSQKWFWLATAVIYVVGVVLSGFYPVFALSSFKPVTVLQGKLLHSIGGIRLRRMLVIFQYIMAVGLLIGTLTVYRQLHFMKSRDLGFDREQILIVKAPRIREAAYEKQFETFKAVLAQQATIQKVCMATEVPGRQILWDAGAIHKAGEDASQGKNYQIVGVDYDFIDLFALKLAAGRGFSREFPSDQEALLLNETAATWMGFASPEAAIGQQVDYWGQIFTIIGVLKDYHQQSVKEAFEPHIFRFMPYGRGKRGHFAMKIQTANINETLSLVEEYYTKFFPGNPFDFFFLDDYFDQQYRADESFGKVFSIFTILALLVTSMGLLGLSAYMVVQRTKEIGIRKVLGSTVMEIIILLSKEFTRWVIIANVIAWPLATVVMNRWLENFALRTGIHFWIYLSAAVIALLSALLTVGWQVLRSARANPIAALRYE